MQTLAIPYTEPVNYKPKDASIYNFTGIAEEAWNPDVKLINNCWWHMGSSKNAGWIKIIMARLGLRYHLQKKQSSAALITDFFSFGYFHWFNDALPKFFLLKSKGIEAVILVPENLKNISFISESGKLLGIEINFYNPSDIIPVKQMYLPGQIAAAGSQHPVYFKQMVNAFKSQRETKPWRKIFISRENSPFRNLEPWQPVKKILLDMGFEIVLTDTMSLIEQINMFSQCSHLAAVHGGGLTNMAFMPENSKVFEIRREDDNQNYCYFKMAHVLNIPYFYFLTSSVNKDQKIQRDNFMADVKKLQIELKRFVA